MNNSMARKWCKLESDWSANAWARADGLWRRESPEQQEAADAAWRRAACESGNLLHVLWCELCQLADDVRPRCAAPESAPVEPSPTRLT
jgi:hypothetical protein